MFRTNRHRYLLFISITLSIGLFCSCNQKPKLYFHYSDGTLIKDSTVIQFLMKELPVQVPEYDSTLSLEVQTCLDQKIEAKLNSYFQKGSMGKVSTMLILENKTGNVVYCRNSEVLSIYSQRLQMMKMYGILLSFEKGVKLTDTFSWTGKYSKKKYDSTVSRLYRMSPPSLDYKYPFDNYSCSQWKSFLQKLDVSENERDCADGEIYPRYYFRTSLFDLVKTGVLINRNGAVSANNLFGNVTDSDGEILHATAFVKGSLLKTETCLSAKKILKRDPFDVIEFNYPIFLYTQKEMRNGMILSTKKYTIGFLSASKSGNNGFVTKEIYSLASLF
ncbi:hypothetical protein [Fluviicola taffensis]|uniref:hypothetical protein n=1 Tax=Fluviicola taffensis TaxID=191579 RepID=UPI003137DF15